MTRLAGYCVLAAAALLEAGGDALIRTGLHSSTVRTRVTLLATGALVLFAYGWLVNAPPWDFGKLLGIYVVFFFIFAQVISWLLFKQLPSTAVLVGGSLIVIGGILIGIANR